MLWARCTWNFLLKNGIINRLIKLMSLEEEPRHSSERSQTRPKEGSSDRDLRQNPRGETEEHEPAPDPTREPFLDPTVLEDMVDLEGFGEARTDLAEQVTDEVQEEAERQLDNLEAREGEGLEGQAEQAPPSPDAAALEAAGAHEVETEAGEDEAPEKESSKSDVEREGSQEQTQDSHEKTDGAGEAETDVSEEKEADAKAPEASAPSFAEASESIKAAFEKSGVLGAGAAALAQLSKLSVFLGKKVSQSLKSVMKSVLSLFGIKGKTPDKKADIEALQPKRHSQRGRDFAEMLKTNPSGSEWLKFANEAAEKYQIPRSYIWSVAHAESRFNPTARPRSRKGGLLSSAYGLGQFIDSTWKEFQEANPEFAKAERDDPRASLHAIAWYARHNANRVNLKVDLNSDEAVLSDLYMAHHEGASGFRRLKRSQETGEAFDVPGSYMGRTFSRYSITVNDHNDYIRLIEKISASVGAGTVSIQKVLDDLESDEVAQTA
jgi:hypothetical protein